MKQLLTILFVIVLQSLQAQTSALTFDKKMHDFGTILEKNGKVSYKFVFQNKSSKAIAIDDVYSDCGCVGRAVSSAPIKPGGRGEVLITFNPDYKSGFFSKEIVVYTNNKQSMNRLWIQGRITPAEHPVEEDYPYNFGSGLYLRLKVMAFGYLNPGETREMELHYANDTNKELILSFAGGNMQGLKINSPGTIAAKGRGVIRVSYTMPLLSTGDVMIKLNPVVNNKKRTETLDIKVLNQSKLTKK